MVSGIVYFYVPGYICLWKDMEGKNVLFTRAKMCQIGCTFSSPPLPNINATRTPAGCQVSQVGKWKASIKNAYQHFYLHIGWAG